MRRRLGSSGLTVTPLALGTMLWGNAVDRHEAGDHLRAFVEAGGNLVDTAYGYGGGDAETILGGLLDGDGPARRPRHLHQGRASPGRAASAGSTCRGAG